MYFMDWKGNCCQSFAFWMWDWDFPSLGVGSTDFKSWTHPPTKKKPPHPCSTTTQTGRKALKEHLLWRPRWKCGVGGCAIETTTMLQAHHSTQRRQKQVRMKIQEGYCLTANLCCSTQNCRKKSIFFFYRNASESLSKANSSTAEAEKRPNHSSLCTKRDWKFPNSTKSLKTLPGFFSIQPLFGGICPPPNMGQHMREHALNVRKIMQNATFPEPAHMWTCSGDQIGKPFDVILGNFGATSTHNQPQSAVRTIFGHFEPFSSHLRPIGLIFCAIFSHL